jgi:hypothetical protein
MIPSVQVRRMTLVFAMVALMLALLAGLSSSAAYAAGAWTAQTSGTTNVLWSVTFADTTHGWAVGDGGTI